MKKNLLIILSSIVFVICFGILIFTNTSRGNQLASLNNQIYELKNEIELKKASKAKAEASVVKQTTGLDTARVAKDTEIAKTLISSVLTWDNYETYNNVRNRLINEYGVKPESQFLNVFMPEVVVSTASDGSTYNRIDTMGLNATYEDMDVYVSNIKNSTYSYFAYVTWSAHDGNGAESIRVDIFMYDVTGDGKIENLNAATVE